MIARRGIDRPAGVGFAHQRQRVSQLGEERELELPQHRCLLASARKLGQRRLVMGEQVAMRVLAGQELQQQFVEVEAADQRRPADPRQASAPFGPEQCLQLALPRPGQEQRLESLQQAAQFGARPLGAARHQRDPSVLCREGLHDEAGLAIGERVQDEGRLIVAAQRLGACGHGRCAVAAQYPNRVSSASSSAQPPFTRTHTSRNTLPPNRRSMSTRAVEAISFIRSPPAPSRIARWLSRST